MNRYILYFKIIFLLLFLQGCGSEEPKETTSIEETSGKVEIYISKKNGTDIDSSGTIDSPYKELSYALNQHKEENIIFYLKSGTYYIFNKKLSKGVELIGTDENNKSTIIAGNLSLLGKNHIESIIFQNSSSIISENGENNIYSSKFTQNKNYSISVQNNSTLNIKDSNIINNSSTGIVVMDNAKLSLSEVNISKNTIGIQIRDNAIINFSNADSQLNHIQNNQKCNFLHSGKKNLELYNVVWNNKPLEFTIQSTCANSFDIVKTGEGDINYIGKIPKRGAISFNSKDKNEILSPFFGEEIYTLTPDIEYTNINRNHLAIAIFDKYPTIKDNVIQNTQDIIWYWHSSLSVNHIGSTISYRDGFIFPTVEKDEYSYNDFQHNPPSLEKGENEKRIYYIIVWEWDLDGIKIVSSSNISYFTISEN